MTYTIEYVMNELIAYGNKLIHEFEKDMPTYCTQNRKLVLEKSNVHGALGMNIYCDKHSIFDADRIAVSILKRSNSVFRFTALKIYINCDGNLIGMFEFDHNTVVFRQRARPYSSLEQESYSNKVEEELNMNAYTNITSNGSVIFTATPTIEKIHISGPCTVIIWSDNTKTMVRLQKGEPYDMEKAVYAAIAKKFIGTNKSKSNWLDIVREKMPDGYRNDVFYGAEKSDIESVKQLLNNIYGAHKDEIEELHKTFEEDNNDKKEAITEKDLKKMVDDGKFDRVRWELSRNVLKSQKAIDKDYNKAISVIKIKEDNDDKN